VNIGNVYRVRTALCKPPKDKLAICCCDSALFLWINTDRRNHAVGQMLLEMSDLPGILRHDSILNCARLTTFPPSELRAAQPLGRISSELARKIINFLNSDPPKTLPPRHLGLIVTNLQAIADLAS
jgi:hypothetical protein